MTDAPAAGTARPNPQSGGGLGVLTAGVQSIGTTIATGGAGVLGYVLLIGGGLAIGLRHRAPGFSFLLVAAATVAYQALHYPAGPTFVALAVAVLSAIRNGRHPLVWVLGPVVFVVWRVLTHGPLIMALWWFGPALLVTAAFGVARMASRMDQQEWRGRQERQRRAASDERLRIAHELHDVLGHHLSLINVRASVGRHLLGRDPDQAGAALDAIRDASAEALREVRSVLDTLYPVEDGIPLAPAPGLDRLAELTVDAGLEVRTVIEGERRPMPAEVERAAYRIVQEALTNVRRHAAAGSRATVTIDYREPDHVTVRIDDDNGGGVAEFADAGNGISGMRERATLLGGWLTAGPRVECGWRVEARLEIPDVTP